MKLNLLILLTLFSFGAIAQNPDTSRARVARNNNDDNTPRGYTTLDANARIRNAQIDSAMWVSRMRLYYVLDSFKTTSGLTLDTTTAATRAWVQMKVDIINAAKQNKLTAGTGITIINDVISSTGGGGGSGDVVTNSFAAKGILANGSDQTSQIQSVYDAGSRVLLMNAASASSYVVNGTLNVPGLHLYITDGNRFTNTLQTGTGTVTVSNLDSIYVDSSAFGGTGWGYTSAPNVIISGATGATAVARISGGKVTGVTITKGAWFTGTPTISFSGGGGTGAVATANVLQYGRFINGTGTNFLSQIKSDYALVVGGVTLGVVNDVRSDTYLKLRSPSPVASSTAAFNYWGGVIRGATIHADIRQKIASKTFTFDCYSASDASSIVWYDADGNDGSPDNESIQKALDDAAVFTKVNTVYAPIGTYVLDKGVYIRSGDNDRQRPYTSVKFIGLGNPFDENIGGGTKLKMNTRTGFGINVQRGKSVLIEGFELEGLNTFIYDYDQENSDTARFWVPGIDTSHNGPYGGIGFDYFGQPNVAIANRAKGFEHLYNETSQAGSSFCQVKRCKVQRFLINYCVSPTGTQQNSEGISFQHVWSAYSLSGYGVYGHQAVTNRLDDWYCWNGTKYALDCARNDSSGVFNGAGFGEGGQMFENENGNLAGFVRWVCRVSNNYGTHRFGHIRAELTYGIGGVMNNTAGGSAKLVFDRLDLRIAGSRAEGSVARTASFLAQAQHITLNNSRVVRYGQPINPININAASLLLYNTELAQVGLGYVPDSTWHYATDYGDGKRFFGTGANDKYTQTTSAVSNATVQNVSASGGSWQYNASSQASTINVGDKVYIYSTAYVNEFNANDYTIPIGFVTNVNTGTGMITVQYLPYGINNGLLLNSVYTKRIPAP